MGTPYYRFFPADYDRDTKHLSLMQHGAYRGFIDWYMNVGPLPNDMDKIYRTLRATSREEQAACEYVLVEFFTLEGGRWHHKRCDEELAYQSDRSTSARASVLAREAKRSINIGSSNDDRTMIDRSSNQNQNQNQSQNQNQKKNPPACQPLPSIVTPVADGGKPLRASRAALVAPSDVSPQVWTDFLQTRKALKAAVTETALAGIRREAGKARMSLEDALRMCCAHGWRGFKAEWVRERRGTGGRGDVTDHNQAAANEWLRRHGIDNINRGEVIDGTAVER